MPRRIFQEVNIARVERLLAFVGLIDQAGLSRLAVERVTDRHLDVWGQLD